MTRKEQLDETIKALDDLMAEWRTAAQGLMEDHEYEADPPDALCVDMRVISRVVVTIGGPATWIEFDHTNGAAEYFTTVPGYSEGLDPVILQLSPDEAQEVDEFFHLTEDMMMRLEGNN